MWSPYLGASLTTLTTILAIACLGCSSLTAVPSPTPSSVPTLAPSPTQDGGPGSTQVYLAETYQGAKFESAEAWDQVVTDWDERRPETPGLIQRLKGIRVGAQTSGALSQDLGILNDKFKHCVVGFEVAMGTDLAVAEYVAWRKEHEYLTDGVPGLFEEEDFRATMDGALRASVEGTEALCEERWGAQDRDWDGTAPPESG